MSAWTALRLEQPWRALGPGFYSEVSPTPLSAPRLRLWNGALASEIGLVLTVGHEAETAQVLGGVTVLPQTAPIATVYAGHQFGVWAGQLGDGRALLLGELNGFELQLKGAGQTPYSRMGDGRAVLRSSIREYLCSEAMYGLGIPTTRALALVASPDPVWRETVETAAVVTRVAPSFLRFGHFEHFFYRGEHGALRTLADFALRRHFPEALDTPTPYQAMLETVVARTAALIASWQAVGFCHGVMNSDNMSLLGLTLDYGPFGFLDGFDAGHICNHSDHHGRYSYANQPEIGRFNLHCLAQALWPLLDRDAAVEALERYQPQFEAELEVRFRDKLGLRASQDSDWPLLLRLFDLMQAARTDWTIFWRRLADFDPTPGAANTALRDLFLDREGFDAWAADYAARLRQEGREPGERAAAMRRVNPKYILRNHLAEVAIRAAREGDFSEAERLARVLARPFDEQPEQDALAGLPPDWAATLSVSCSS